MLRLLSGATGSRPLRTCSQAATMVPIWAVIFTAASIAASRSVPVADFWECRAHSSGGPSPQREPPRASSAERCRRSEEPRDARHDQT